MAVYIIEKQCEEFAVNVRDARTNKFLYSVDLFDNIGDANKYCRKNPIPKNVYYDVVCINDADEDSEEYYAYAEVRKAKKRTEAIRARRESRAISRRRR